jgi:hypothetical protein
MNYDILYQNIQDGAYTSKLSYKEDKQAYRNDQWLLEKQFKFDLRGYVEYEVGKPLTDKQWYPFYDFVWDIGHSAGYNEVLIYAGELIEVIVPFIKEV